MYVLNKKEKNNGIRLRGRFRREALKIDFDIDFDALLEEAKAKRKEYDDVIDKWRHTYICEPGIMDYPENVKPILREARDRYLNWTDTNITKRGLSLELDMLGRPIAITAILAGKKN